MGVKGKVLLQNFYKSKLRNETKTYLEQKISLFVVKFKKLGFGAPLKPKSDTWTSQLSSLKKKKICYK